TNDAIIMIDSKDRVQFWNEGAEDMFGYTEEEAKEKRSHEMIAPEKYKDQYEKGMKKFRATRNGKVLGDTIEVEAEKRDGSTFPVELSISSLEMNDELHAVAVIRDITKRKKAEERENFLHSLLRHDVANKNRVVQGYLELLKEYDLPDEVVKLVKKSEIAIEKSIKLIEKVRILREAQNEEIKEVDISSIIKNTVSQIRPMIKEAGMEIDKECPEDTIMVKGGPLIDNVFSNIIENSIKHSDGSKLRIHAEITQDEVICILEDDGKGIPEEDESYIFEKGYTTDEERGTGLGLFLVKMLLEIYDGEIEVKKSELGGPRFDIHLKRK
ncbi:MAG: PAS domain-containing sensor histidine kinase, partial [Thermoplasmatota archaeon]